MSGKEGQRTEEYRKAEEDKTAAENEGEMRPSSQGRRKLSAGDLMGYSSATSSLMESETETEKRKRSERSPEDREKKKTKIKRSEEPSLGNVEELEDLGDEKGDPLVNLAKLLERMKGWWKQPTIMKMVTKPQTEKFQRYLDLYQEELIRAREDRARMETRIEERADLVKIVREEIKKGVPEKQEETPRAGYAAAVARNAPKVPKVTGVKGPVLPTPKRIIVRHENKDSEEVKTTLKRLVKPSEIGLKVRRLINIRNGVIVEAENEEGAENLLKQKSLTEAGLKVEKPSKKRPVVMIYDINASLSDEEIKDEVYTRNVRGSEIDEDRFKQEFEIRHKYKDKKSSGGKNHIVVECSVSVRNWLRRQEKIFVEWQCCRVKDYVDVARCYKCQRFGHIAKHCTAAKPSCSYCAGEHDFKECPNKKKKEAVCCANCKRESRGNVKHDSSSRTCPAYEKAVKRQNEKTDYGI